MVRDGDVASTIVAYGKGNRPIEKSLPPPYPPQR